MFCKKKADLIIRRNGYYKHLWEEFNVLPNAASTALVFHAHIIPSTEEFFKFIYTAGFRKSHVLITGKPYSTVNETRESLKGAGIRIIDSDDSFVPGFYEIGIQKLSDTTFSELLHLSEVEKYILCDSGGVLAQQFSCHAPSFFGKDVVGCEFTTQGTYPKYIYPTIEVALSGAKKNIESPFIARSIFSEIAGRIDLPSKKIGIIGYGDIGKSISDVFLSHGNFVRCYDIVVSKVPKDIFTDLVTLIDTCSVIIGCTGRSSIDSFHLKNQKGHKIFVSASSKDSEFKNILIDYHDQIELRPAFSDLHIDITDEMSIVILNGGFPLNFNRSAHVVKENEAEIMLTRGLWLAGIAQAVSNKFERNTVQLSAVFEEIVVRSWIQYFEGVLSNERKADALRFINRKHTLTN